MEKIFVTLVLIWYSDAMTVPLLYFTGGGVAAEFSSAEIYPARRLLLAIMYFIILVLVLRYRKRVLSLLLSNPILILFVCWAFLSVFWSVAPNVSLRRSVGLLVATTFGILIATFNPREMLRLLAWALSLVMLVSLIAVLVIPDMGIMSGTHEGAWRGTFSHKNALGAYALLSLIVLSPSTLHRHRWPLWILFGALLLLSNAKTPIIAGVILAAVSILVMNLKQRSIFSVPKMAFFCVLLIISMGLGWVGIDTILNVFGGDSTLTGRTRLWSLVWETIQSRIWLGHGYYAGLKRVLTGEALPNAHNALLEVWLGLGIVGVVLILSSFFNTLFRALKDAHRVGGDIAVWTLIFLGYIFLLSVTESSLIGNASLTWVLYVAAAALHTQVQERRSVLVKETQLQHKIQRPPKT